MVVISAALLVHNCHNNKQYRLKHRTALTNSTNYFLEETFPSCQIEWLSVSGLATGDILLKDEVGTGETATLNLAYIIVHQDVYVSWSQFYSILIPVFKNLHKTQPIGFRDMMFVNKQLQKTWFLW
jgi:hypothetical protein